MELSSSRPPKVFDVSILASASSMPMAEKFPGSGGITTVGIDNSRGKSTWGAGPPPAVTEQHEIARIEPVFDRDPPDRSGHDHGGDRNYSVRHSDHASASVVTERLSDALLDGPLSRFYVELHL